MEKSKKEYENINVEDRKNEDDLIREHVYWAVAGGLIPVPLLDIASVTAIQMDMIKQLCEVYEVNYSRNQVKSFISALTGSTLASVGASVLKALPGLGTIVGGLSMSIMSGASTYAVGKVFAIHFQSGGDLDNINIDNFKDYYKQKFEEGKEVAEDLKKQYTNKAKKKKKGETVDIEKRLKKLKKMKKQGEITEEEFITLKKKLIEDAS